ncbi:MAG TPA: DUF3108 domain-containing protein [Cytophagaceae bacterium]|jgi:hypothetical protein|nr:DUF3108 domain-containing protein [Cytophagaceae bacterium]
MNRSLSVSFILLFSFFSFTKREQITLIPTNYRPNESFELRVHYGFLTAGEAKVEVSDQHYLVNNKVCMKATCTGRSSGSFDLIIRIRDSWSTYIDTVSKISQRSFRHIEEGKYRRTEFVQFDYSGKKAIVDWENRDKSKEHREYDIAGDLQDIVSGAYYLRVIDYDKLKINDVFEINSFFEDKLYNFKIRYKGREHIKTEFGKINAIRLAPIMPENGLFSGENSIRLWLSDDKNRLPLKIQAEMFVGAVEIDLKGYQNLKYPIHFKK